MSDEEALLLACAACMEDVNGDIATPCHDKQTGSHFYDQEKEKKSRHHCQKNKPSLVTHTLTKQRQTDKEFLAHKQQLMCALASNACDHSPKGAVDCKCLQLMHMLNTHDDYVTTSSCSGRIALFHSGSLHETRSGGCAAADSARAAVMMKRGDKNALGWLLAKHGVLTEREMDILVRCFCGEISSDNVIKSDESYAGENNEAADELQGAWVRGGVLNSDNIIPSFGMIALKMEPFVMHVECRTIESAKLLLSAAVADGGFRNSGVTPPGKKTMCAIRHAAGVGLDVPLVVDGVNYVWGQHNYVRRLLEMANEKMIANDVKLRRLEAGVAARLWGQKSELGCLPALRPGEESSGRAKETEKEK